MRLTIDEVNEMNRHYEELGGDCEFEFDKNGYLETFECTYLNFQDINAAYKTMKWMADKKGVEL